MKCALCGKDKTRVIFDRDFCEACIVSSCEEKLARVEEEKRLQNEYLASSNNECNYRPVAGMEKQHCPGSCLIHHDKPKEECVFYKPDERSEAFADANSNADRSPCVVVNHPPIRDPYGVREPAARFGCHRYSYDIKSYCHLDREKFAGWCNHATQLALIGKRREDCAFWREVR